MRLEQRDKEKRVCLIALLLAKNEERMLAITLPSLKDKVDGIILLDDGSSDGTRRLARRHGAKVFRLLPGASDLMSDKRTRLLEIGRAEGGTHFVCLDADEALIVDDLSTFRGTVASLEPGQKLLLHWVSLWRSPHKYRDDRSVWSRMWKDFIFADKPGLCFEARFLSEARTPGPNTNQTLTRFPEARVLHFQFVPWKRFQMKQAWYRCLELLKKPGRARRINYQYSITLDDGDVRLRNIPRAWLKGLKIPPHMSDWPVDWHLNEILRLFDERGVRFFEPLQIWHIPELRKRFVKETGREPRSETYPRVFVACLRLAGRIIFSLRGGR